MPHTTSILRKHPTGNFLQDFGADHGGPPGMVARRIELDNVGSNDVSLHGMQASDCLAHTHPAWFPMGDSRRKRGIEHINVERKVNRALKLEAGSPGHSRDAVFHR